MVIFVTNFILNATIVIFDDIKIAALAEDRREVPLIVFMTIVKHDIYVSNWLFLLVVFYHNATIATIEAIEIFIYTISCRKVPLVVFCDNC